jgi:hypothetical protein
MTPFKGGLPRVVSPLDDGESSPEKRANPLLPAFNVDQVRYMYRTRGQGIVRRFVDGIEYFNEDRLGSILDNGVRTFQAYGPHLSQMDYMVPHEATYRFGLNPLRVVTGKNLMSPLYRHSLAVATGIDLPRWGILLKDRDESSQGKLLEYVRAVEETLLEEGFSVGAWFEGGYPEGARDRWFSERGRIRDVPPAFFLPALRAQRKMDEPLKLLCVTPRYDGIPEEGYWDLIKNSRLGPHFWDAVAHWNWLFNKRKKGIARVNFSTPVNITEIAGKGPIKTQLSNLAAYTHETVTQLYREMA